MLKVFVVSDATGQTAEQVVRAALVQFQEASVKMVRRRNTRTPEEVRAVVEEAAEQDSIILHTLVSDRLRRLMFAESRLHGVDSFDMLGPVLERLATHLQLAPQEKPGLFRQMEEARSREIEAVAFAFRHDDGQNPEQLDRAEVVLVGVSRTMKTPAMLYLAYRGWFAANVPLIPEIDLPPALLSLPAQRVFHLHMAPDRLLKLRRVRAESEAIPLDPYASWEHIERELRYARQECRKRGWRTIDVTGKSVEEVCRELIALLPKERHVGGTAE
jgi:regulator of PEP synthase PpsR (kinase-PPPase family)